MPSISTINNLDFTYFGNERLKFASTNLDSRLLIVKINGSDQKLFFGSAPLLYRDLGSQKITQPDICHNYNSIIETCRHNISMKHRFLRTMPLHTQIFAHKSVCRLTVLRNAMLPNLPVGKGNHFRTGHGRLRYASIKGPTSKLGALKWAKSVYTVVIPF